jgi:hypothetical protein
MTRRLPVEVAHDHPIRRLRRLSAGQRDALADFLDDLLHSGGEMDPDACYRTMCDSLAARDDAGAREAARNLLRWLNRDGCPPRGMARSAVKAQCRHVIAKTNGEGG